MKKKDLWNLVIDRNIHSLQLGFILSQMWKFKFDSITIKF